MSDCLRKRRLEIGGFQWERRVERRYTFQPFVAVGPAGVEALCKLKGAVLNYLDGGERTIVGQLSLEAGNQGHASDAIDKVVIQAVLEHVLASRLRNSSQSLLEGRHCEICKGASSGVGALIHNVVKSTRYRRDIMFAQREACFIAWSLEARPFSSMQRHEEACRKISAIGLHTGLIDKAFGFILKHILVSRILNSTASFRPERYTELRKWAEQAHVDPLLLTRFDNVMNAIWYRRDCQLNKCFIAWSLEACPFSSVQRHEDACHNMSALEFFIGLGIASRYQVVSQAWRKVQMITCRKIVIAWFFVSKVEASMREENVSTLEAVCNAACLAGLDQNDVVIRGVRLAIELRLSIAIDSADVEQLEHALKMVEGTGGVSESIVRAARQRVRAIHQHQSDDTAVETFAAAMSVGRADRHNKLAQLLASALAKQSPNNALGDLVHKMQGNGLSSCRHSRVYSLSRKLYGDRGGRPYFKPSGWLRYAVNRHDFDSKYKEWCVCYHGTMPKSVAPILRSGLQRPGDEGVVVAHGQARSTTGKTIYLSPSIEYAAFPCYSQFFELGDQHWAQIVLQCRVRPDSFKERDGTLGPNKHWPVDVPIDINFTGIIGLEWLLEDASDIVVYGLCVREFGPAVDRSIYGELAQQVRPMGGSGPEYHWTKLRVDFMRRAVRLL